MGSTYTSVLEVHDSSHGRIAGARYARFRAVFVSVGDFDRGSDHFVASAKGLRVAGGTHMAKRAMHCSVLWQTLEPGLVDDVKWSFRGAAETGESGRGDHVADPLLARLRSKA